VTGLIFKPIAVPDGKLGIVAGNVTTKPADVCDHVNVAALPSNETEVIGATRLVASESDGQLRARRRNAFVKRIEKSVGATVKRKLPSVGVTQARLP